VGFPDLAEVLVYDPGHRAPQFCHCEVYFCSLFGDCFPEVSVFNLMIAAQIIKD